MSGKRLRDTEERILEAAINIFAEKGYSAATTSEIARKAEVAEGTIFKYFPRKKDLLHGVVLKLVDLLGETVVFSSLNQLVQEYRDKPVEELLKAIVRDRINLFQKYFPLFKVILYEMQFHQDVRELFYSKIARKAIKMGRDIFEEGKRKGELRDINAMVAIRSFMGMLFLMLIQRQFLPSENAAESIEEEMDMLVDIFLNGVKADKDTES